MRYTRIVIVFLGFGVSMVGMSFVKKLFRRKTTKLSKDKDNVSEAGMSPMLGVISNESIIESTQNKTNSTKDKGLNVVPSTSSSSENSDSPINRRVRQNRRTLNSVLRKYRKSEKRLQRKKKEIFQMENEIENLMLAIKNNELLMEYIKADFNDKQLEVLALTSNISSESEDEIKKRENHCYQRHTAIKNAVDFKSVLNMIRQKQKALNNLEILTFKKYWSLVHKVNTKKEHTDWLRPGIENWFHRTIPNDFSSELFTPSQNETHEEVANSTTENVYINSSFLSLIGAEDTV